MKRLSVNLFQIITSIIVSFTVFSCDKTDEPAPPTECRRTVLVYQAANNNLGSAGYNEMDIKEMCMAAANGKIPTDGRLIVYNDAPGSKPLLLEIKKNTVDTLKIYNRDILSVASERMLEVFDDAAAFAPSQEFGLVLWSHGSGWLQDGMSDISASSISPLSFGNDKGHTMNITTLAEVLRQGPELCFLYFDCCYMMSVETLYELKDAAPLIVGSATELPVYGMPYDENVEHFFSKDPSMILAATNTYNLYNSLNGSARTCSMSVVDTRYLDELAIATAEIFSNVSAGMPIGYTPQRFMSRMVPTCYYFDMENYIQSLCIDGNGSERFPGGGDLYEAYLSALNNCVLYKAATPRLWDEFDITYHCGLSTYIVDDESKITNKNYNALRWYADVVSQINF